MDEYIKKIDSIYRVISTLNASGDAVDVIAAVRTMLRELRADMEAEKAKEAASEAAAMAAKAEEVAT